MKILITGNLGYVGGAVVREFRRSFPTATLIGFDIGYFSHILTSSVPAPETLLDYQFFGDIREFPIGLLKDVDTVVNLAAISNDPIGNRFEEVTMDINYKAAFRLACMAKKHGVKNFIYASSCSVYGKADTVDRDEKGTPNPLTAYARSKVATEEALSKIADNTFKVTCLRFATACGMSDRLRLDLVLNDFVAGAISNGEISIMSDGSPWRPLIHNRDMARAIRWAHNREIDNGGNFLIVNTGTDTWNYQVKELALAVKQILPTISVKINRRAQPDKRSYRVNFGLFQKLAPDSQPQMNLLDSIEDLRTGFSYMNFTDTKFRDSTLMRLNAINTMRENGILDKNLRRLK